MSSRFASSSNPAISIIVPCYNHGIFIDEALQSVDLLKYAEYFEIIIVNDGSTDLHTIEKLAGLKSEGYHIIDQPNQGLAVARNTAVAASRGKYILPMDSDNKIVPEVMLEGLKILEQDESLAVLYTDASYFGNREGHWQPAPFDIYRMLNGNYIDACALIRKEVLQRLGGYDPGMPAMGHEDWDLWLRIAFSGGKFHHLPKIGFFYRVANNSMSETSTVPGIEKNKNYLFAKHATQVSEYYSSLFHKFHHQEYVYANLEGRLRHQRFRTAVKALIGRKLWSS